MPRHKTVLRRRRKDRWIGGSESRSLTAHFVDSLMTGAPALPAEELEIPGTEADVVRVGDPDVRPLQAEYVGDEAPGASTPTPDQNLIDATGLAYGVAHTQGGALRASSEVLDRRDEGRPGLPKSTTGRSL